MHEASRPTFSFGRAQRLDKRGFVQVLQSRIRFKQVDDPIALQLQVKPHVQPATVSAQTGHRPQQVSSARMAVSVPKKYFKRAVDRNRAKRVLREQFRQHAIRQSAADMVLSVRSRFDLWSPAGRLRFAQSVTTLLSTALKRVR